MRRTFICFLLVVSVLSCNDSGRTKQQVESLWKNPEKSIDNFDYIYQLASKDSKSLDSLIDVSKILTNEKIDKIKLRKLYFNETIDTTKTNINTNIFLENSGSMFGYFRGRTDAESTLARLLIHSGLFFGKDDLSFSFITNKITEQDIKGSVVEFIDRLEPEKMKVGSYGKSKIADIIKTVINNTKKNDLSILISDCIYSLESGKDI